MNPLGDLNMYLTDTTIDEYEDKIDKLIDVLNLRSPISPPLSVQETFALDLQDRHNAHRNIIGFGFGEKLIDGVPQGVLAICMYVVRKVPFTDIHPDYLAQHLIPNILDRQVLSDVIEVGRPRLLHHVNQDYKRVPGGAALGSATRKTSGTLGGWLIDESKKFYLLSCWNCIDGVPGGRRGNYVLQPLGGRNIAVIAASIDPATCAPSTTTLDACIAEVMDQQSIGDFVLQIGEIQGEKIYCSPLRQWPLEQSTRWLTTKEVSLEKTSRGC
jgi:hypothetical protein